MVSVEQSGGQPAEASHIRVTVAYSPAARQVDQVELELPCGATVLSALHASGLLARHALGEPESLAVGVWMKPRPLDTLLRAQDRVEIYRPLTVDPKEARRQRYRKQARG